MKIPAFIDSSETFAKLFDSLAILNSRNDPFRNIRSLHKPSFRVGLTRTVCGSVCLSVEKAIENNYISDIEFNLILHEIEQYKSLKRQLINKAKSSSEVDVGVREQIREDYRKKLGSLVTITK